MFYRYVEINKTHTHWLKRSSSYCTYFWAGVSAPTWVSFQNNVHKATFQNKTRGSAKHTQKHTHTPLWRVSVSCCSCCLGCFFSPSSSSWTWAPRPRPTAHSPARPHLRTTRLRLAETQRRCGRHCRSRSPLQGREGGRAARWGWGVGGCVCV